MFRILRTILFRLDPETAHHISLALMSLVGRSPTLESITSWMFQAPQIPVKVFGLTFPNPIGIAAGYDKDGTAWRGLACLGFGHIEVGTVTPRPQSGNPRPRIFRLAEEKAVINRMGFPGEGAEHLSKHIKDRSSSNVILGVNLGVNKDTPMEKAVDDYEYLMRIFAPLADYLVINVSSPNTVGLRRLQARESLSNLLAQFKQERLVQQTRLNRRVPLLVKLAPDLTDSELDDALEVIQVNDLDGVIATNTSVSRIGVDSEKSRQSGGLSGAPLRTLSTQMVRKISQRTQGQLPIIGVGGVMSFDDAQEKMDAGADLVQVYTGIVFEGPGLGKRILQGWSGL